MFPIVIALTLTAVLIAVIAARFYYFGIKIARNLAQLTSPHEQHPTNPVSRILCLGDSMAYGVGVSDPAESLVGKIGRDFPNSEITNISKLGLTVRGATRLVSLRNPGKCDVILVMVGGMHAILPTSETRLRQDLTELSQVLRQISEKIIFLVPNHTGDMPLYHFPFKMMLNMRARVVRRVFFERCGSLGLIALDQHVDMLAHDMRRYYGRDKVHPNSAGYATWYRQFAPEFKKALGDLQKFR
jgi:lysophospholipase L1-like esterase